MNYLRIATKLAGVSVAFAAASLLPVTAQINPPSPNDLGEVMMKAAIGSFKILPRGVVKPSGKITMNFQGSLLVTGLQPGTKFAITGNVRKEYESEKGKRVCYFGRGTVTIDGVFESLLWFGRDLSMTWAGQGVCRVYGEFDKTGMTGTYTVKGDKTRYWGSGGMQFALPLANYLKKEKPKVKILPGKG